MFPPSDPGLPPFGLVSGARVTAGRPGSRSLTIAPVVQILYCARQAAATGWAWAPGPREDTSSLLGMRSPVSRRQSCPFLLSLPTAPAGSSRGCFLPVWGGLPVRFRCGSFPSEPASLPGAAAVVRDGGVVCDGDHFQAPHGQALDGRLGGAEEQGHGWCWKCGPVGPGRAPQREGRGGWWWGRGGRVERLPGFDTYSQRSPTQAPHPVFSSAPRVTPVAPTCARSTYKGCPGPARLGSHTCSFPTRLFLCLDCPLTRTCHPTRGKSELSPPWGAFLITPMGSQHLRHKLSRAPTRLH